jgi:hypothetical protein
VFFDINALLEQSQSFLRDANRDEEITRYQSQQQLRFNASRSETKDIQLTTQEGDIVTISSAEQFQASYLSFDYSEIARGPSNATQSTTTQPTTWQSMDYNGEKFHTTSSSNFNISVDGHLNEEEKEDIAFVLDQMDEMMADLIAGDIEEVMAGAVSLIDNTDTISSVNAVLEFHQEVRMEQQVFTRIKGEGLHRPPHPPHHEAGQMEEHQMFSGSRLVAQISNRMIELIENASIESEKLEQPINELFNKFKDQLAMDANNPENSLKTQLLEQIQGNVDEMFPQVQESQLQES